MAAPPVSRFQRLARTHAAMAAGDAAMTVALADSVLFNISADAARGKVLLFLAISFVPFLFVAPLIGPVIDRMKGGRRLVIQIVTIVRIVLSVLMAFHADDVLLFPLAFGAMVMQKTYAVSKSALVPSVVRSDEELVEANSKLGLISGLIGFIAIAPAGILQKTIGATATLLYGAAIFGVALVCATRLPREVVAAQDADGAEKQELRSGGVVLASRAMFLVRASVGFCFFHLFFWYRRQEAGLLWFGASLAVSAVLTMCGNAIAPHVRHRFREETMLTGALGIIAVAGVGTAILGGVVGGVLLAGTVNFSAALSRLAFDSIVQRDAPDANAGRAFAQFETRFQLGWVLAGVIPVMLVVPGELGFLVVGVIAAIATVLYKAPAASRVRLPRRLRTSGTSESRIAARERAGLRPLTKPPRAERALPPPRPAESTRRRSRDAGDRDRAIAPLPRSMTKSSAPDQTADARRSTFRRPPAPPR